VGAFRDLFPRPKPLIGVIHLPALPGYSRSPGLSAVLAKALSDLAALAEGGTDGVLVENENDRPHRVEAAPETIAVMTRVAREVVSRSRLPVGVEILLNDPKASLAVAHASGARFIRTDYFVDPMERPEHGGAMKIDAEGLLAYRDAIGAGAVLILADIQVKYARMLVERSLDVSARLARERRADAVVVTGDRTAEPPGPLAVEEARRGASGIPVLIGSGLDEGNARELLRSADGAIVGTSLKTGEDVDAEKVARLVREARLA